MDPWRRDPARGSAVHAPWPLEELVRAQRMACEGLDIDAIAEALCRTSEEVRRKLDPAPTTLRPEFAGVGYGHLKRR